MSIVHHGTVFGVVNAEDTDFGLVDDGRSTQPTKSPKAGDGEGGTGQVVNAGFPVSRAWVTRPISAADCQISMASTCFTTGT